MMPIHSKSRNYMITVYELHDIDMMICISMNLCTYENTYCMIICFLLVKNMYKNAYIYIHMYVCE